MNAGVNQPNPAKVSSKSSNYGATPSPPARDRFSPRNQLHISVPVAGNSERHRDTKGSPTYKYAPPVNSPVRQSVSPNVAQSSSVLSSVKRNLNGNKHGFTHTSNAVPAPPPPAPMKMNIAPIITGRLVSSPLNLKGSPKSATSSPKKRVVLNDSPTIVYFSSSSTTIETEVSVEQKPATTHGATAFNDPSYMNYLQSHIIPPSYLLDRNIYNIDGTRIHEPLHSQTVPTSNMDIAVDDILMPIPAQEDTNEYNEFDGTRVHPDIIPESVAFADELRAWDAEAAAAQAARAQTGMNVFARVFVPCISTDGAGLSNSAVEDVVVAASPASAVLLFGLPASTDEGVYQGCAASVEMRMHMDDLVLAALEKKFGQNSATHV
ncbi:hypothetical protein HDU81_010111 [Chytriomyces hyalinus]|nr:hypothetical protein HDU81_010111 [Chytriomyces hyalinus]